MDTAGVVDDDTGGVRLPAPPGRLRQFWSNHPHLTDMGLMLLWAAASIQAVTITTDTRSDTVIALILDAVALAGIPFRRTRPWITVALSGASVLALGWAAGAFPPLLFAVYAASVWWTPRMGWITVAVAEVAAAGVATFRILVVQGGEGGVADLFSFQLVVLLLVAVLIGANIGSRRRYLSALIDRAQQLGREQDQRAQLAVAAERSRIAREMHDIVSHSVTVMVRLAEGAAATLPAENGPTAEAMHGVARVGRGAMTDMRRMLGVLGGDNDAAFSPNPTIGDLPSLVHDFRALGSPVTLEIEGAAPDDSSLQLAAYRIVQEGLTNATRYARTATEVRAHIISTAALIHVSIVDDGTVVAGTTTPGRGLVGITERVAALSGNVTAGPRADHDGWAIHATLPVRSEQR